MATPGKIPPKMTGWLEQQYQKKQQRRRELLKEAYKLRMEMKLMKSREPSTIWEALMLIGRRTDRSWLERVLKLRGRGVSLDDALDVATRENYSLLGASRDSVMKKAQAKLAQPDVCRAMESIFELQGFTMENAAELQVKHIRGELTKEVLNSQGEVVELRISPSYAALKDYWAMTVPKQTTKVQMATLNVNEMLREAEAQDGMEEVIHGRVIGQVIDTDPQMSDDDIDPFADDDIDDEDEQDDDV